MQQLSHRNPRVAEVRALARQTKVRRETGRYIVEGATLLAEAIAADVRLVSVFVEPDAHLDALVGDAQAEGAEAFLLDEGVIERLTATVSPQPIVAVAEKPTVDLVRFPPTATFVVGAVDVGDPGNIGTIVRSAVASGADGVVLAGACADPFSPKAVRASAGALFRVPLAVESDAGAALAMLADRGLIRLGARMVDASVCDEVDLTRPVAVLVGNEAHGLPAEISAHIDEWVRIPMPGPTESLNVAMSATVLAYEAARQRRRSTDPGRPVA